jgi:hypothetical protein
MVGFVNGDDFSAQAIGENRSVGVVFWNSASGEDATVTDDFEPLGFRLTSSF